MNTNTRKTKGFILIAVGIAILVTAACLWWVFVRPQSESSVTPVNLDPPTKGQSGAGEVAKKEFTAKETEASQQTKPDTTSTNIEEAQLTTIYVQIVSATVAEKTLNISTVIQTIDSTGECLLTLTRDNSIYLTKTVKTQTMGSYTTCQNFDANTSTLQSGTYTAQVKYVGSKNRIGVATKDIAL